MSGHLLMQKLKYKTKGEVQLVHVTLLVHDEHSAGQSWHTLVSLYIFLGHSVMHMLLYRIPVIQLRHVLVVLVQVLHGAEHEMHVWLRYSS